MTMKYRMIGLVMVLVLGLFGFGGACDKLSEVCGPCGEVTMGDSTISGDARLDGFFKAVGSLGNGTAKIQADFRANLEDIAAAFDVEGAADMELDALVTAVKGAVEGRISATAEGGLKVEFQPPKCSANVSVAVEAQASCEAKADCEISAECSAGEVDVSCSGACSGSCEGECTGGSLECKAELSATGGCEGKCSGSCEVKGPSVACEGACNGTCTVEAGASCTGECTGNCTGTCDGSTVDGVACAGECEGTCSAECNIQGAANCSGSCNGKCEYTPPDGNCSGSCKGECTVVVETAAECTGEAPKCTGKCEGKCSAECNGTVTPPSCSAEGECSASADCQASASAEASASMECTPPSLDIAFDFQANLDAQAKAEFMADIELFRVKMMAIAQGMFKLRALVDAEYAAEIGIESPVAIIGGQLEAMVSADIGSFDVAPGLIPCVIPAFEDAISIVGSVVTDTAGTISGQIEIFAIIQG
jgi:hypothetical protein